MNAIKITCQNKQDEEKKVYDGKINQLNDVLAMKNKQLIDLINRDRGGRNIKK